MFTDKTNPYLVLLLLVICIIGCKSRLPKDYSIDRGGGSDGTAYDLITLDIPDIKTIYLPMYHNYLWNKGVDEYISTQPSVPGTMVILVKKRAYASTVHKFNIGHVDGARKDMGFIYKINREKQELYIRPIGDTRCTNATYSVGCEVQVPQSVEVLFYEGPLYEVNNNLPFYSQEEREQELAIIRNAKLPEKQIYGHLIPDWTVCEEEPTALRHLPGIKVVERGGEEYDRDHSEARRLEFYESLNKRNASSTTLIE